MINMKYTLWILTASVVLALGINRPLCAAKLEKNEISGGLEATSVMSQDDEVAGYVIIVPYLSHAYELELSDAAAFTLDSQADFTLEKVSIDEETANAANVAIEPALEWSPWEVVTLRAVLPFGFSNAKPGEKNADRENTIELASMSELEYSTMDDELHGISSWDEFQRGVTITTGYRHQLYMQDADEKANDLDQAIGVEVEYSYFNEETFFMVTPSFSLFKHVNSKVDESLEIEAVVDLVKDVNEWLTIGVEVGINSVKEDSGADFESEVDLAGKATVSQFENLTISTRYGYIRNVSDSGADPAYTVTLGVEYDIF